jgi:hypothetical protein
VERPLRLITSEPVDELAHTLEALLVVASQPLTVEDLAVAADDDLARVEQALELLGERFSRGPERHRPRVCRRGLRVPCLPGGRGGGAPASSSARSNVASRRLRSRPSP